MHTALKRHIAELATIGVALGKIRRIVLGG
jgi:hypothetical protein